MSDSQKPLQYDSVCCAVISVSSTNRPETDAAGQTAIDMLHNAGHDIATRQVISDDPGKLHEILITLRDSRDLHVILVLGGTGIGPRDNSFEAVTALLTKRIPGYGELFRSLSYREIGAAAAMSRVVGGLIGRTLVYTMPGSPAAARLAMEKILLPEIGHLVAEARQE